MGVDMEAAVTVEEANGLVPQMHVLRLEVTCSESSESTPRHLPM